MADKPDILEAMARAIARENWRDYVIEFGKDDPNAGPIEDEEECWKGWERHARAALTAALDHMQSPSMGMCDKGADMPAAGDDFPEAIAEWVWQAMLSQQRKEVGL